MACNLSGAPCDIAAVGPGSIRLSTNRGHVVTAKHVVIAAGYEVDTLLPDLAISLHSSFALVTEPIDGLDRRYPDGVLFWDHDDPYLYGRTTDDGRLLVAEQTRGVGGVVVGLPGVA